MNEDINQIDSLVRNGWVIEEDGTDYVTLVSGAKINHILHLLISVFTGGLWLVPWLIIAMRGGEKRMTLQK